MTATHAPPRRARARVRTPERLRVVDDQRPVDRPRRRLRLAAGAVLVVVGLLAALFGLAVFHAQLAEGRFVLEDLDRSEADLQNRLTELEIEVATLEAPSRVGDVAAGMGLVDSQAVYLAPDPALVAEVRAAAETFEEETGGVADPGVSG